MRIGIIGLGRAGKVHLEAWQAVSNIDVIAVSDRSQEIRRWAREAGLAAYANPLDLLARVPLDAVSICAPPAYHTALAVACLERGLDVLCEKPLALDDRGALKMLRTATRQRRHLLLATKFR